MEAEGDAVDTEDELEGKVDGLVIITAFVCGELHREGDDCDEEPATLGCSI